MLENIKVTMRDGGNSENADAIEKKITLAREDIDRAVRFYAAQDAGKAMSKMADEARSERTESVSDWLINNLVAYPLAVYGAYVLKKVPQKISKEAEQFDPAQVPEGASVELGDVAREQIRRKVLGVTHEERVGPVVMKDIEVDRIKTEFLFSKEESDYESQIAYNQTIRSLVGSALVGIHLKLAKFETEHPDVVVSHLKKVAAVKKDLVDVVAKEYGVSAEHVCFEDMGVRSSLFKLVKNMSSFVEKLKQGYTADEIRYRMVIDALDRLIAMNMFTLAATSKSREEDPKHTLESEEEDDNNDEEDGDADEDEDGGYNKRMDIIESLKKERAALRAANPGIDESVKEKAKRT